MPKQKRIMDDLKQKKIKEELARVKCTCQNSSYWVENKRNSRIWADDDINEKKLRMKATNEK
jgi:hypothetical protein